MPACSALNCSYKHQNKESGKTIHRFPFSRPDILAKWVRNVRRENWYPSKCSVLCSDHFEKRCYEDGNYSIAKLKKEAVPTLFRFLPDLQKGPHNRVKSETCSPIIHHLDQQRLSHKQTPEGLVKSETCPPNELNKSHLEQERPSPKQTLQKLVKSETCPPTKSNRHYLRQKRLSPEQTPQAQVISETCPSTEVNQNNLEQQRLLHEQERLTVRQTTETNIPDSSLNKQNVLLERKLATAMAKNQTLKKALKSKQQIIRRLRKTTNSLNELVKDLKKEQRINGNPLLTLQKHYTGFTLDLLIRMLKNKNNQQTKETYSPLLRKFAITLHSHSSNAYDYVRSVFRRALPHPSVLRNWRNAIKKEASTSSGATPTLKASPELVNEQSKKLDCSTFNTSSELASGQSKNLDCSTLDTSSELANEQSKKLDCSLVLVEMSVKHIQNDEKMSCVDIGSGIEDVDEVQAALVNLVNL